MKKRSPHPAAGHRISHYDELRDYIKAFANGHLNLLILLGGAGLAKSQTVKREVQGACWIEGNATAFGVYTALWQHRDQPVVLDDIDSLYSDRNAVRLLKCLCQTDQVKWVAWHSVSARLEKMGIPRQFETSSRVIIIANEWRTLDRNVSAVQDRGHMIRFEPTAEEVHREVHTWFEDDEILRWFGQQLPLIASPSMRHYIRAAELKASGLAWRQLVLNDSLPAKTRLVAQLRADPTLQNEQERIRQFAARGGGCRATYFNHAKRLRGLLRSNPCRRMA